MTSPNFSDRRRRLIEKIGLDAQHAILVSDPTNVSYLTGFRGDSSLLLLERDRQTILSDGRYTVQLAEECPDVDALIRLQTESLANLLARTINSRNITQIAFEASHLTIATLRTYSKDTHAKWVEYSGAVESLRMIKDEFELSAIKKAIAVAESAFVELLAQPIMGRTEREIANELEYILRKAGASKSSFQIIVGAGPTSALPHAIPGELRARPDQVLLIDWGALVDGYVSDLTRVLMVEPDDTYRKLHPIVDAARQAGIKALKAGVKASEIDHAVRQTIVEAGYGQYFNHGTGHGFGMAVHEQPFFRYDSDLVLRPGMVVTIEPGIYIPEWGGIRLEDDLLVTETGSELLSSLPRQIADHPTFSIR